MKTIITGLLLSSIAFVVLFFYPTETSSKEIIVFTGLSLIGACFVVIAHRKKVLFMQQEFVWIACIAYFVAIVILFIPGAVSLAGLMSGIICATAASTTWNDNDAIGTIFFSSIALLAFIPSTLLLFFGP